MEQIQRIPDELLDRFGTFYSSEFVEKNMPWIRQLTFEQYVQREMESRKAQKDSAA